MADSSASVADYEYKVLLLGAPELWRGSQRLTVRRRQVRALIYFLAHGLAPVTREQLTFLFWSDHPEAAARRNLTRLLSAARAELGDDSFFVTEQDQVSLNPHRVWSDCVAFDASQHSASRLALEEAVSLVRGRYLDGFSLPASPAFGNWQDDAGRQIEQRHLELLVRLIDLCQQSGDLNAAMAYARRYLVIDELAEDVHRRLIGLFAMNGDRAAATRQFEACTLVLERELGVRPLPETRAAYEAALTEQGRPAATAEPVTPTWSVLPSLDLPLTGRQKALQVLGTAYEHLQTGGLILISGEPGVGKSRLMQAFATEVPALVLAGNNPPGAQTMAYTAIAESLRQALAHRERWHGIRPVWLAEVRRLLPDLDEHFPDLPPPLTVEPAQAKARLLEGLSQSVFGLASRGPLLLCLDDLHWADVETTGWLSTLAGRLAGSHVCLLATCRDKEAATLRDLKRAFARVGLLSEITLAGLTTDAVGRLIQQLPGHPSDTQSLAQRVQHATGGNAFFVLETLRILLEAGRLAHSPHDLPLAPTVEAAIRRRLDNLSSLGRQLLETAAILESDLRLEYLKETAGRSEMEVAEGLDELVARQLLVNGGVHRFSHDLLRQVTYEGTSPWRRRILHRRAALVLEGNALHGDERPWAAIARHYDRAGDATEAIRCYRRAARSAGRLFAHEEAIQHLQRAVKLAGSIGDETDDVYRLHEVLGDNLTIAGRFATAEKSYRAALSLAPDDPLRLAELQRKLASMFPPQQRADEAETLYRAALARLDGPPPEADVSPWQSTRLNILLGLLDALYSQTRPELMAALEKRTQSLLDEVGTFEQQANYYARLGQMSFLKNRFRVVADNVDSAQKALSYAHRSQNVMVITRQQFHLGFVFLWYGNLQEAEAMLRQALENVEELGDAWLHTQCLVYLTILCRLQGRVDEVQNLLAPLSERSRQVGNSMYIGVSQAMAAWIHYRAGKWSRAQAQAQGAIATWRGYPFQWLAHWILLDIALKQARVQDALSAARAMLDAGQQRLPDDVQALLDAAVSAWDAGDRVSARDMLDGALQEAQQSGYL